MVADRTVEATGIVRRTRSSGTLAVIDVGSNTARFVVFEASAAGAVRAVFETKDSPRLGLAIAADGALTEAAIARGIQTVRRFGRLIESLGVPKTLGVATSAVRDAPNGTEFVKEVDRATGVDLRVLSGAEEARYAYLGVAGTCELSNDIVCDLGGGSLQLAEVHGGVLRNSVSLPLGALRLSQRFFEHDPPKRRERDSLRDHVRETVRSAVEAFGRRPDRLVTVGGTVRALARASIDLRAFPVRRVHGYFLYDHDVEALDELLGEMSASKRKAVPGIGADRADVVLAGITVIEELERAAGVDHVVVSGAGIREGIALEAVGAKLPVGAEELVDRSIAAAAESLSFRVELSEELTDAALALFSLLAPRFEWGKGERLALRVAAGLHDAGVAIDLWNHPQHASYLVRNYPIWGLEPREMLLASMVAYLHEGDDPPSEWKKGFLPILKGSDLTVAGRLAAVLEVAEVLAPARPRFTSTGGGRSVSVGFSGGSDSALPSRWLEKIRKPMERVLDVEVKVRDG